MNEKTLQERFDDHTQHLRGLYAREIRKLIKEADRDETRPGYVFSVKCQSNRVQDAKKELDKHMERSLEEFDEADKRLKEFLEECFSF